MRIGKFGSFGTGIKEPFLIPAEQGCPGGFMDIEISHQAATKRQQQTLWMSHTAPSSLGRVEPISPDLCWVSFWIPNYCRFPFGAVKLFYIFFSFFNGDFLCPHLVLMCTLNDFFFFFFVPDQLLVVPQCHGCFPCHLNTQGVKSPCPWWQEGGMGNSHLHKVWVCP